MEGTHSLRDSNSRRKFQLSDKSKESDDNRIKREWCGVRSMRTTVRVLWRDDFINGYQDYIAIKAVRIRTRQIHPAVGFETSGRLNL